jgi:hypothetical protein
MEKINLSLVLIFGGDMKIDVWKAFGSNELSFFNLSVLKNSNIVTHTAVIKKLSTS